MIISISKNLIKLFQNQIVNWAKHNLVEYPWRKNRTPYRILISEVLLTRTKAAQVAPVYNKFIEKYPNLEKFLDMKEEIIEALIKSLGLLYRVEKFKKLAEHIKNTFNRKIPNNFLELKFLSGIGDYGANAILCFGFNQKRPLIDSNFIRVYKRVFNVSSKTKTPKTDKYLWKFSEELLPIKNYIQFNYGIIDLGGNICVHNKPKCNICPVNQICYYFNRKSENLIEK